MSPSIPMARSATAMVVLLALLGTAGCGGGGGDDAPAAAAASIDPGAADRPIAAVQTREAGIGQVVLDASGSRVTSGRQIVHYQWRVDGAPAASGYADYVGETVTVDADDPLLELDADQAGEYRFALRIHDGQGYSDWLAVTVTVTAVAPPLVLTPPAPPTPPPSPTPAPTPPPPPFPPMPADVPDDPQPAARLAEIDFGFVDSDIDRIERRLVVLGDDRRLYIQDLDQRTGRFVTLARPGHSVSVSPRGRYAVVSHDALVSRIDLATGQVTGTYPVSMDVGDIAYGNDERVFALPRNVGVWTPFVMLDLDSGATVDSTGMPLHGGEAARLDPSGRFLFTISSAHVSPGDVTRHDVQGGTPTTLYDSPYHGDYAICGDVWVSSDSARIFTGCGTVLSATASPATDLRYAGSLGSPTLYLAGLDSDVERDRIVALQASAHPWPYPSWGEPATDQAVLHFDYRHLQRTSQQPLPTYDFAGGRDRLHGRSVWLSADGQHYYVVAVTGEGHASPYRTAILSYAF